MISIQPKFDRVLIKRDTLSNELRAQQSKIILPESVNKSNLSEKGTVVAVGRSAGLYLDDELIESIEIGARVIFAKHAGVEVRLDNDSKDVYYLIQDNDILATITEG